MKVDRSTIEYEVRVSYGPHARRRVFRGGSLRRVFVMQKEEERQPGTHVYDWIDMIEEERWAYRRRVWDVEAVIDAVTRLRAFGYYAITWSRDGYVSVEVGEGEPCARTWHRANPVALTAAPVAIRDRRPCCDPMKSYERAVAAFQEQMHGWDPSEDEAESILEAQTRIHTGTDEPRRCWACDALERQRDYLADRLRHGQRVMAALSPDDPRLPEQSAKWGGVPVRGSAARGGMPAWRAALAPPGRLRVLRGARLLMVARYRLSRLLDPAVIRAERKAGGWPPCRVMTFAEIAEECDVPDAPHSVEPSTRPTWGELCALEPRLLDLAREALETDNSKPRFCANAVWYGYRGHRGLKPRLCWLVSWEAAQYAPPLLRTRAAYDLAYQTIYHALPDCQRGCGCFSA